MKKNEFLIQAYYYPFTRIAICSVSRGQITELKQKINVMELQHASMATKLKEYEVSPSSPRILPRTPRKVSEVYFLKSIETILETKLVVEERVFFVFLCF